MQTTENDNVVSIFSAKSKSEEADKVEEKNEEDLTFEEIMTRNKRNSDRMRKERNSANKSVLRSYRIKH